jgi:hypothetical protein
VFLATGAKAPSSWQLPIFAFELHRAAERSLLISRFSIPWWGRSL